MTPSSAPPPDDVRQGPAPQIPAMQGPATEGSAIGGTALRNPTAEPPAPGAAGSRVAPGVFDALDEAAAAGGHSQTRREEAFAQQQDRLVTGRLGIASSLFAALRCKHPATATHSLRVALAASKWAAVLDMPEPLRTQFELAALLHDVGKIGVPDRVLDKPGRLSAEEVALVDRHTSMAVDVLRSAGAPPALIETVVAAAAWYDGTHRRVGLQGDAIPVFSRMLAIVDAFDAMTTDLVYRRAKSRERALAELFEYAGRQFDPTLVQSFSRLFEQDQSVLERDVTERWLGAVSGDSLPWEPTAAPSPPADASGAAADTPPPGGGFAFYQKMIDNTHEGVVFVDLDRRITQWNTGAERLTGVAADAAIGQVLTPTLLDMSHRDGKRLSDAECPIAQTISSGLQLMESISVMGRAGRHVAAVLHVIPVATPGGGAQGATVLLTDVSTEASLEAKCQTLHAEMTKDPLTQVANRAEFDRMLEAFTDAHQETGMPCSLIMADIDHFKRVNDTYGHQAGDEAIVTFAELLKSMCRTGDLVARYGGEEFAVLCADCNNAAAAQRAEAFRKALCELPLAELGNKNITASFGVTELQAGDRPDTMLRRADRALLQAKDQGRNQVVQLGEGMAEEIKSKSWWPFATWRGSSLVEASLVTNVPLNVAVQKLRGFIADHDAKILRTAEHEIRLEATDAGSGRNRRQEDRPVTFVVDVSLAEEHVDRENSAGLASGAYVQTRAAVTIRPRRDRDRRRSAVTDRARLLLGSLKSYLMAKEAAAEEAAIG
ncbi:MAG: diguanylate cyclase [Planctomycetota bacterium]